MSDFDSFTNMISYIKCMYYEFWMNSKSIYMLIHIPLKIWSFFYVSINLELQNI